MDDRPVIELRRASSARRAVAWVLDGGPFALLAAAMAGWLGADLGLLLPAMTAVALAAFVYQLLCHWLLGATFGKRSAGLRVVGPDGGRPGLGRSARRAAASVLGVILLGTGPLVALFTRSGRGLNDLAAGTAVVEAP
jgi:resuscitation-promoting factor RpfA